MIRYFQCLLILFVLTFPVNAQQQTPTMPGPTPDVNGIRQRLKDSTLGYHNPGKESLKQEKQAKPDTTKKTPPRPDAKMPAAKRQASKKDNARQASPVQTVQGSGSPLSSIPGARVISTGQYEPYREKPLVYGEVPDEGEPLTLSGPMRVEEFLYALAVATKWNILVTDAAKNVELQYWIEATPPKQAMEVLQFHDVFYEYNAETNYLRVMTRAERLAQEYGAPHEQGFVVQHAPIDYMESVFTSLLSPGGRMMVDPRTNHILVWDTEENLAEMAEAVKRLDVPLTQAEFVVHYAEVADMEAILSPLQSPGGTIIGDARTGRLLVRDLKENVEQMRLAIEKFDVPIESRVFAVKHANAEELIDSIESMLSERGTVHADMRSNSLVVTDVPTRQADIAQVLMSLDAGLTTKTWTLDYIEPDVVAERIESLIPEEMGSVVINEAVHQITVTAIAERVERVGELIAEWDVRRRQVQIEAYLVSVNDTVARSLDIDWSYFSNVDGNPIAIRVNNGASPDYSRLGNTATIGQLPYAALLRDPITGDPIENIQGDAVIDEFRGSSLAMTLDYLNTRGQATILSSPRVTVQDGEEAAFQSGRSVPYVTSTTYGLGQVQDVNVDDEDDGVNVFYPSYARPYNQIAFIEVGTILRVLPRITDTGTVLLDIIAEDSDADLVRVISNGEENTIPEKRMNRSETQVRVNDGQTIVIGGLRKTNNERDVTKALPILSDIPLLGRLFKSTSRDVVNDTLMIFLTTTIVDESTQPEAQRLAAVDDDFAKAYREEQKSTLGRWGNRLTQGKDEVQVSVGQSGHMFSDSHEVTLDDVRQRLSALKNPACAKLVVRKHPRAPEAVLDALAELGIEYGVCVQFDFGTPAFVPDYGAMSGTDHPAPESSLDGALPIVVEATEVRK